MAHKCNQMFHVFMQNRCRCLVVNMVTHIVCNYAMATVKYINVLVLL
jgi:hypothetical protein